MSIETKAEEYRSRRYVNNWKRLLEHLEWLEKLLGNRDAMHHTFRIADGICSGMSIDKFKLIADIVFVREAVGMCPSSRWPKAALKRMNSIWSYYEFRYADPEKVKEGLPL